jgi:hypothetical protein
VAKYPMPQPCNETRLSIKRNKLLTYITTWVTEILMLSERSQTKRSRHHRIPFREKSRKCKQIDNKKHITDLISTFIILIAVMLL